MILIYFFIILASSTNLIKLKLVFKFLLELILNRSVIFLEHFIELLIISINSNLMLYLYNIFILLYYYIILLGLLLILPL